jgi:hypothetical protein
MKRTYNSPEMHWVPVCSNSAVADVCWAYANNVKPFYYNTYGRGYAELYAMGGKCNKNVFFEIRYYPEDLSAEEKAMADADMQRVIAQVTAEMPNKPNNYKGSNFSPSVDPSWS